MGKTNELFYKCTFDLLVDGEISVNEAKKRRAVHETAERMKAEERERRLNEPIFDRPTGDWALDAAILRQRAQVEGHLSEMLWPRPSSCPVFDLYINDIKVYSHGT